MGQVYKARDTRLNRLVAVKVLSKLDSGLRERFEREAKAIAALSDPHICTLHDVGHQDGAEFLVMEYLEGHTLAERISKGPLPLDLALTYAREIAAALETAHRAGIVHRDLKPANVMITKDGTKLLDFGVAKLQPKPVADATVTMPDPEVTHPGLIIGTLLYMAPEQLEGKPVDSRADLWALGCIVYEMVTGERAFDGTTQASVIGAILHEQPAPVTLKQPLAPATLDRIVMRCLSKDPASRWQTSTDLGEAFRWVAAAQSTQAPATAAPASSWTRTILRVAVAALLIAFGAAATFFFYRSREDVLLSRLDVVTPPTSDPFAFALSPDGRQLVFSAPQDGIAKLWLRPLDQAEARPLPGTENASAPFWSPDGRSIGFFADGKLKRLDLGAGVAQVLATAPDGRGGAWASDGTIVFAPTNLTGLLRVSASGGTPVPLTTPDPTNEVSHRWPQVLPDGRLLFFVLSFGNDRPSGIYLASSDGSGKKRLLSADSGALWAPPGYLLLVDQGVLVARTLDLKNGAVGAPVPLARPIGTDFTVWRSAFSVSNAGVLTHRTVSSASRQLVWIDRAGNRLGTVGDVNENAQLQPVLSPDGRRVAVQRTALGAPHTWIFENGSDVPVRLRQDVGADGRAVWTPDGRRLAVVAAIQGHAGLIEKPVGAAGSERVLVPGSGGGGLTPLDYSEDGRYLLYSISDEKTGWDIWAVPLNGGNPLPVLQTPFNEELGQLSRDGKWIAYQSNESGRTEVYIRPFLREGAAISISSGGGIAPRWRRDGKELFYVSTDGSLVSVTIHESRDGNTIEPAEHTKLFRVPIVGGGSMIIGGMQQYAVSPDGRRSLVNMTISEANAPITVVLNWPAALKR